MRINQTSLLKFVAVIALCTLSIGANAASKPDWFDRSVNAELSNMAEIRHELHEIPELGNQEIKTQRFIVNYLKKVGIDKVIEGYKGSKTAVIGVINPNKGDAIGLRADIDALPLKENTNLPYASKAHGLMWGKDTSVSHMCGHDAHMAMLLTAAKILEEHKDNIPRKIVLVFQPAEEGDSLENPLLTEHPKVSGARKLVHDGLIEDFNITHMFGIHVQARSQAGLLEIASGPAMNSGDGFEINVKGVQAHGGMPWLGVDAALVTSQIVVNLQQIVSRNINNSEGMGVITVGKIEAGDTMNVVTNHGRILGTVRANHPEIRKTLLKRIPEVAEYTAKAAGATATTRILEACAVTWNDPKLTALTLEHFKNWGINAVPTTRNPGASEDFSYYAQKIPSVFMFLGVDMPGEKNAPNNHSDKFIINDAALKTGVEAHIGAALGDYSSLKQEK